MPADITRLSDLSDAAKLLWNVLQFFTWREYNPTNHELAELCGWYLPGGAPNTDKVKRTLRELERHPLRLIVREIDRESWYVRSRIRVNLTVPLKDREAGPRPSRQTESRMAPAPRPGGATAPPRVAPAPGPRVAPAPPSSDRCRQSASDAPRSPEREEAPRNDNEAAPEATTTVEAMKETLFGRSGPTTRPTTPTRPELPPAAPDDDDEPHEVPPEWEDLEIDRPADPSMTVAEDEPETEEERAEMWANAPWKRENRRRGSTPFIASPDLARDVARLQALAPTLTADELERFEAHNAKVRASILLDAENRGWSRIAREQFELALAPPRRVPHTPTDREGWEPMMAAMRDGRFEVIPHIAGFLADRFRDADSRGLYLAALREVATGEVSFDDFQDWVRQATGPNVENPGSVFAHARKRTKLRNQEARR